jgi:hypothetical protein
MTYSNKVVRSKSITNGFIVEICGDVVDEKGVVHYVTNEVFCKDIEQVCSVTTQFLDGENR